MNEDYGNKENLDSLLDTLVTYSRFYHKSFSKESLIHNLPIEFGEKDPELFFLNSSKGIFARAAENAGLKTVLVKKQLKDISSLQLPIILLLSNAKSCIVDSFSEDRKKVKIIGELSNEITQQWYDIERIEKEYLGYAILVKKILHFTDIDDEKDKSNYNVKHWFWSTLKISKSIYRDVILASILINLFVLATPLFTMNVYDRVIPNNAIETLWFFATGILIVYFIDIIIKLMRSYFLEIAAKKSDIIISSLIFGKILNLKIEQIPKPIGSFANNIKNFDSIRSFLTNATLVAFIDLPFSILFLFVIYYLGNIIVVVPLVIICIIIITATLLRIQIQKYVKQINQIISKKNATLIETLSSIETLKTLGGSNNLRWKWEEGNGKIAQIGLKSRMLASFIPSFTALLVQINTVCIVILGVYLINDFQLSMGALIAIVILSSRVVGPMGQVAGLITQYEDAKDAYKSLNELMHKSEERPQNNNFISRDKLKGKIEFRNVTFKYPNTEVEVLKDVSFIINPGDKVAFLGKIGTGKSTILKLILKLFEPTSGSILIDDIDISQLDPADIRRNTSYVSQNISLFNGTLKDNIIFRTSFADDQTMLNAAKISGIDSFANNHPRGYDMEIGENGEGLSGGQIQSVGIARACLFDYPINLFDEPTSAMDKQTEENILKNLNSFMNNKTLIVVTQKMPILQIVDKVIVFNNNTVYLAGDRDKVIETLSKGKNFE